MKKDKFWNLCFAQNRKISYFSSHLGSRAHILKLERSEKMIKSYVKYWKKAFKYDGFSSRADYWWVFLINAIIFAILGVVRFFVVVPMVYRLMNDGHDLTQAQLITRAQDIMTKPSGGLLAVLVTSALVGLVILIPNVTLTARRLRDAGFPAWISLAFGLAALYGIVTMFVSAHSLVLVNTVCQLVILLTYIFSLFPAKYKEEEDDDSRNYD